MSQTAMFTKTGSADFPSFLKCMITGPPKSGKTTMLGTVPNILILDTEPHANNLQSLAHLDIPCKAIYSTDDLRQAQFVLSQESFRQQAAQALGIPDIQAVAIDTVDTLQAIMKKERMRESRRSEFLRDDWGWLKEELTAILESFLALPMHVFLLVHTKTKDVGSEKNPKTIVLPGLEGAIAEQIAGMVGYSMLSYRTEEIRPDGTKFTKYWLRAEGNETYEFLGNRAAGRLPDIIEPDFKTIYQAAMAGRPTTQHQQVPVNLGIQTTSQAATPATPVNGQQVAQNSGQPQQQPQQASAAPATGDGTPQDMPGDGDPVNAAALTHVKRVYDSIGASFPEDKIRALNMGQARGLVKTFKAAMADAAEGKGPDGVAVMTEYLKGQGLLADPGQAAETKSAVVPDLNGTIEQVKAYVGDDLQRANEAFDAERTGKNRKSLMDWLESKGASHGGAAPVAPVQTPVQDQDPMAVDRRASGLDPMPAESVTSDTPAADVPDEESAVSNAREGLGAEVQSVEINADALCEECGNKIDDVDLAALGQGRFKRILCVAHYIAETKKSRV